MLCMIIVSMKNKCAITMLLNGFSITICPSSKSMIDIIAVATIVQLSHGFYRATVSVLTKIQHPRIYRRKSCNTLSLNVIFTIAISLQPIDEKYKGKRSSNES